MYQIMIELADCDLFSALVPATWLILHRTRCDEVFSSVIYILFKYKLRASERVSRQEEKNGRQNVTADFQSKLRNTVPD